MTYSKKFYKRQTNTILKRELKVQNWSTFGDLNRNISTAQYHIFVIQNRLASEGHFNDLFAWKLKQLQIQENC